MLRITELRLPLDHAPDALRPAGAARLGIPNAQLGELTVVKRSYDARKKSAVVLIYTVDVTLAAGVGEADVLSRYGAAHPGDHHLKPSPDTTYRPVVVAQPAFPGGGQRRPVVIGFGPCGLFAALVLAQMGLRPIVLERGSHTRSKKNPGKRPRKGG